ncbi:MAG: ACT domain-containing protein [Anaerolineales bacterium]
MSNLKLELLDGRFAIHRFGETNDIPAEVFRSGFFNICKTDEELSIVCPSSLELNSENSNSDWACIKVIGPLDFNLIGVLAKLLGILAEAQISILTLSTYDTDYILIKSEKVKEAKAVLEAADYKFKSKSN